VLLLVTARTSLVGDDDDSAAVPAEEIELKPLSKDTCRVILDQLLGRLGALEPSDAEAIAAHIGGNPLFLEDPLNVPYSEGWMALKRSGRPSR